MTVQALGDLTAAAGLAASVQSVVELVGTDPVYKTRYRVGTASAAALGAVGLAASELWMLRTGRRQKVGVDVRAAAASLRFVRYFSMNGQRGRDPAGPISGFYPVRNGRWVFIHGSYTHLAARAADVLGVAVDKADVRRAVQSWDGEVFEQALLAAGGCATLTRTPQEWQAHPQYAAVAAAPVVQISRIGDAPAEPLPAGGRPLSGIRVVDVTRVIAGPTCGRTLAEHGAEVLKISRRDLPNSGSSELASGLGKRSAYLDLRIPAEANILRGLVRTGDVFSQSYRPGALASLAFSPLDVASIRPGIVYATLSAWGNSGPFAQYRGYDSLVSNANGMTLMSGSDGEPREFPTRALDYIAGYLMAFGVMVALHRRAHEGGSWLVETSLASAGHWIARLGLLSPEETAAVREPTSEEIAALSMETVMGGSRLRHLAPIVQMSETPPHWERPPSELGADPPEWLTRA